MNWKIKSKQEINDHLAKTGDATGGYEFLPWIIYMRYGYLFGLFFNLAVGMYGFFTTGSGSNTDPVAWGVGIFFSAAAITISLMLRREYKNLQKGIST
jgi:hypothetical protein